MGGVGVFPSSKKGTFEQRRLTVISQISGFISHWDHGYAKVLTDISYCTFHSAEDVEALNLLQRYDG